MIIKKETEEFYFINNYRQSIKPLNEPCKEGRLPIFFIII